VRNPEVLALDAGDVGVGDRDPEAGDPASAGPA